MKERPTHGLAKGRLGLRRKKWPDCSLCAGVVKDSFLEEAVLRAGECFTVEWSPDGGILEGALDQESGDSSVVLVLAANSTKFLPSSVISYTHRSWDCDFLQISTPTSESGEQESSVGARQ